MRAWVGPNSPADAPIPTIADLTRATVAHDDFVTCSEVDCMGCAAFVRKGGNHVPLIDALLRIERART